MLTALDKSEQMCYHRGVNGSLVPYEEGAISLRTQLDTLTSKQRLFLLFKTVGANDREAYLQTGIQEDTYRKWKRSNVEFRVANERLSVPQVLETRIAAQALILEPYCAAALRQLAEMAVKPWSKLISGAEYQAKWKCLTALLRSQGLDIEAPPQGPRSLTYAQTIVQVLKEAEGETASPALLREDRAEVREVL